MPGSCLFLLFLTGTLFLYFVASSTLLFNVCHFVFRWGAFFLTNKPHNTDNSAAATRIKHWSDPSLPPAPVSPEGQQNPAPRLASYNNRLNKACIAYINVLQTTRDYPRPYSWWATAAVTGYRPRLPARVSRESPGATRRFVLEQARTKNRSWTLRPVHVPKESAIIF